MKGFTHSPYYPLLLGIILLSISLPSAMQQFSTFSFFQEVVAAPIEPSKKPIKPRANHSKQKKTWFQKLYSPKNTKTQQSHSKGVLFLILGFILIILFTLTSIWVWDEITYAGCSNLGLILTAVLMASVTLVVIGIVLIIKGLIMMNIKPIGKYGKPLKGAEKISYELKELVQSYTLLDAEKDTEYILKRKRQVKKKILTKVDHLQNWYPNLQAQLKKLLVKQKKQKAQSVHEQKVLEQQIAGKHTLLKEIQEMQKHKDDFDDLLNYLKQIETK